MKAGTKRQESSSSSAPRLSHTAIVDEALALLNEKGFEGVTLRALAARLGVRAPTLYWYVSSKDALLSAMMEHLFLKCLERVPRHLSWADWMRAFGRETWHDASTTRDFGKLVSMTDLDEQVFGRIEEQVKAQLQKLDLPPEEAMELQAGVQALVVGWSTLLHAPYADRFSRLLRGNLAPIESIDALVAGIEARRSIAI